MFNLSSVIAATNAAISQTSQTDALKSPPRLASKDVPAVIDNPAGNQRPLASSRFSVEILGESHIELTNPKDGHLVDAKLQEQKGSNPKKYTLEAFSLSHGPKATPPELNDRMEFNCNTDGTLVSRSTSISDKEVYKQPIVECILSKETTAKVLTELTDKHNSLFHWTEKDEKGNFVVDDATVAETEKALKEKLAIPKDAEITVEVINSEMLDKRQRTSGPVEQSSTNHITYMKITIGGQQKPYLEESLLIPEKKAK